jgi:thiamine biosynthesis lipoprotein
MSSAAAAGRALGTTTRVVVTQPGALPTVVRLLDEALRALDRAASRFRDDSEIEALNRAGSGHVGPVLRDALTACLRMAAATGGLTDPTIGGAVRAAGYDRRFAELPTWSGHLPAPAPLPWSWRDVQVEPTVSGAWVRVPQGCLLDLGAVAKSWLADEVAQRAVREVPGGVLVDLGGDLAVAGPPPRGGWLIGLPEASPLTPAAPPPPPSSVIMEKWWSDTPAEPPLLHDHGSGRGGRTDVVSIRAGGIATSAQDVRRWRTIDGPAHHIIDPRTGLPAVTPWRTVTVHAATAAEANAASTAAMVLGDDAPAWLAGLGLAARLLPLDGSPAHLVGPWPAPTGLAA